MKLVDAINDSEVKDLVLKIYKHPAFEKLRVAFVSHCPDEKADAAKSHGIYLGTRYVFNEIERLATTPPPAKPQKKEGYSGRDPDLA